MEHRSGAGCDEVAAISDGTYAALAVPVLFQRGEKRNCSSPSRHTLGFAYFMQNLATSATHSAVVLVGRRLFYRHFWGWALGELKKSQ